MHRRAPLLIVTFVVFALMSWGMAQARLPQSYAEMRATPTEGPSPTSTSTPVCPTCRYVPLIRSQIVPTDIPTVTPPPTSTPTEIAPGCAAEYPTVCIPPPPPDLNCADIPYRNFTVLPPDRHHFDTDHDGIGCEQ
jgi:hypothetical protein